MRTFFIFLFVAIVSLIVYNPEMVDFRSYVDDLAQKRQFDQQRTALVTRMLRSDTVSLGSATTAYSTERNNYLIFSTYKMKVTASQEEYLVGNYLGIAGMFFDMGADDLSGVTVSVP